ncbi:hypothetical protein HBI33_066640 [Parastagonospora nodorum]|nr:hypothetical protein HBI33_066640 [Parastagonospora nodorum]
MTDSPRARTPINLSAVLYEQSAAQPGFPAEVSNMDLDFVPGVAFIPDVYMADSLRARTLINLSAVLPRARTLINLSAVLYEQADARSGLPAEVSIMDLDFVPGVAFNAMGNVELTGDFLTALLNPRSLALKRPALSGSDLDCGRTDPTIATLLAKRIKTDEDRKKSTHRQGFNGSSSDDDDVQLVGDNIEELICVAGNNRNNLNIMVTNPTGREFGRVDMKSLTGLCLLIDGAKLLRPVFELQRYDYYNLQDGLTPRELGSIYVLRSVDEIWADVADVFDTVVSKSDEVPTRELSTLYFMWDKEQDYSAEEHDYCKFYCLVITGEDTHCKQIIKKAYIMLLERASLILFMT